MSAEFFLRIIFMIILGIAGGFWGYDLSKLNPPEIVRYTIGIALVGALTGLILTPYFTTRPARALRRLLGRIAAETQLDVARGDAIRGVAHVDGEPHEEIVGIPAVLVYAVKPLVNHDFSDAR